MKNTFVKVLSVVMALTMIMGSFVFVASAADAHTHVYSKTVVPATCKTQGYTIFECTCGDYYLGNTTNVLTECREADLVDVAVSAPTCTEPAYVAHKECKLCGKMYNNKLELIPVGELEPVAGSKPLGHDLKLEIVDPDCGVAGAMKLACQREGCTFTEDQFTTSADGTGADEKCTLAGHTVADYAYEIVTAPTCTTDGVANFVCQIEGCDGGFYGIVITAKGHDEIVTTTPASCLEDGSTVTTCSRCEYRDVDVIPATGHKYDSDANTPGYQNDLEKWDDCAANNDVIGDLYKAPTCYQEGYQWVHCMNLGCECESFEEALETGHIYKVVLPRETAHVPVTTVIGTETVDKYYYVIDDKNESTNDVIYSEKNDIDEMIAWFRANVSWFTVCEYTVNGYTKCKFCGEYTLVAEQTHIAEGHKLESPEGNGADEKVKTAQGGNQFIDTKGWDIVWSSVPCDGNMNYAIRECKECNWQDPAGDGAYYFTVDCVPYYTCDDPTCTNKTEVTIKAGYPGEAEVEVDSCDDCTHAGRRIVCYYGCSMNTAAVHTAHDFEVTEEVAEVANCTMPAKYVWACANANCAETKNDYIADQLTVIETDGGEIVVGKAEYLDPDVHGPSVEVVEATCKAGGYKYGTCDWCGVLIDETSPVDPDAHNFDATKHEDYVPATCLKAGQYGCDYCKICTEWIYTDEDGEVVDTDTKEIPVDPANHEQEVDTATQLPVKVWHATCVDPFKAIYAYPCCGASDYFVTGVVNPSNHVKYTYVDNEVTAVETRLLTVQAATPNCTTDGRHSYTYCTGCDAVTNVYNVTGADAAATGCIYDDHREISALLNTEKGTCADALGHGAGENCALQSCTLKKHSILADCIEVVDADLAFDNSDLDAINDLDYLTALLATLAADEDIDDIIADMTDLRDEYYEENVTRDEIVSEGVKEDPNNDKTFLEYVVIPAFGHDFYFPETATVASHNILKVFVPETCTAPGNDWKIKCTRCDAIDPENDGSVILPHGLDAIKKVDGVAATCTLPGSVAGNYCDLCPKDDDVHHVNCSVCLGHSDDSVIDKLGHNLQVHTGVGVQTADCLKPGYTFYKCANGCNALTEDAWNCDGNDYYDAKGASNHSYNDVVTLPGCATQGYTTHRCSICGDVKVDTYVAAKGHIDNNGNPISFSCKQNAYEINRGVECKECLKMITIDAANEVVNGIHNANIDHNFVTVVVAPGCEADGYKYEQCSDCGYVKAALDSTTGKWEPIHTVDADVLMLGHDVADIVEDKCLAATPEHDGYCTWICANCGEEFVTDIPYTRDVALSLTVDPYLAGKNADDLTFLNGGYIEVLLSVTAESLKFNSFKYTLGFDSDLLTYVSHEFVYGEFGENVTHSVNDNNVVFAGFFAGEANGCFDGVNVPVLKVIFKVAPGVEDIDSTDLYSAAVEFDNGATGTINTPVLKTIPTIEFALKGDVNGDGAYTFEDAKLIKDMIGAVEYSDVADIDNNGAVELTDFAMFAKFVTSDMTIADYYDMFGINVVELANAYEHDDYNDDGIITNVDEKLFREDVVKFCKADWKNAVTNEDGNFAAILDARNDYLLS